MLSVHKYHKKVQFKVKVALKQGLIEQIVIGNFYLSNSRINTATNSTYSRYIFFNFIVQI